jgi:hypothetical protein
MLYRIVGTYLTTSCPLYFRAQLLFAFHQTARLETVELKLNVMPALSALTLEDFAIENAVMVALRAQARDVVNRLKVSVKAVLIDQCSAELKAKVYCRGHNLFCKSESDFLRPPKVGAELLNRVRI